MNFKECYEKYLARTATPEEEAFVEEQLAKSEKILALLEKEEVSASLAADGEESSASKAEKEGDSTSAPADDAPITVNEAGEPSIKERIADAVAQGRLVISEKLMSASTKIRPGNEAEVKKIKKSFLKKTVVRSVVVSVIVVAVIAAIAASVIFGVSLTAANKDRLDENQIREIAFEYVANKNLFPEGEEVFIKEIDYELELKLDLNKSYFECEVTMSSESGKTVEIMVHSKTGRVELIDIQANNRGNEADASGDEGFQNEESRGAAFVEKSRKLSGKSAA